MIFANGFGPTNQPVTSGSTTQGGTLSPLPAIQVGGITTTAQFAGLVAPGEYQFNVVIPASLGNGDKSITATYGGVSAQSNALITIHNQAAFIRAGILAHLKKRESERQKQPRN